MGDQMSAKENKIRLKAWIAEQLENAVRFTAVMYRGWPEGFDRREAKTVEEIRVIRDQMLAEYEGKNYGRGVLVYAITHNGMTVHVEV